MPQSEVRHTKMSEPYGPILLLFFFFSPIRHSHPPITKRSTRKTPKNINNGKLLSKTQNAELLLYYYYSHRMYRKIMWQ